MKLTSKGNFIFMTYIEKILTFVLLYFENKEKEAELSANLVSA